jgi:arylsulfatase A-like enzyme
MNSPADRPNFVFIMADDLGYADLGCYGGRAPVSPNLDRMADEGVRFTDAYANSPVCSPTRFALMTGRYQYRLRGAAEEPLTSRYRGSAELGLSPEHPTLPSLLRGAGYHTALVGKWHLGFAPHFGPLKSGYQEFFGAMGGGLDYFTHQDSNGTHDLYDGDTQTHEVGYLTDLISDRAVRCIEASAGRRQPFFLSVHYTAPHWPWETRDDEAEAGRIAGALAHTDGGSVQTYQSMIHHMDEGIGRILDALHAQGLDESTVVVFTSDNGAERFSDTWPLVGKKMDLLEGGIRVPLLVRWPGRIAAGRVSRQVTITMDWVATFLEWAGVAPHPEYPLDGESLCAHVETQGQPNQRVLYWRMKYRDQQALRDGDWKYLSIEGDDYLFNLAHDARERANLARRDPERLARMRTAYAHWCETMPAIPQDARSVLVYSHKDMP